MEDDNNQRRLDSRAVEWPDESTEVKDIREESINLKRFLDKFESAIESFKIRILETKKDESPGQEVTKIETVDLKEKVGLFAEMIKKEYGSESGPLR